MQEVFELNYLQVTGIGRETVDKLLNFAGPRCVVRSYTVAAESVIKMGWWPFGGGKGDIQAKKLHEQQQDSKQSPLQDLQLKQQTADGDLLGVALPKPTSIFEFGDLVPVGNDVLRGMCAGSDPDAIHACTWTIEQAQGKGRERKPKYRVEF